MTWLHRASSRAWWSNSATSATSSTAELMYTEVHEIEKVTGSSFAEWERELGRNSITVPATLCLRRGTLGS
jgi:hypothetical protein